MTSASFMRAIVARAPRFTTCESSRRGDHAGLDDARVDPAAVERASFRRHHPARRVQPNRSVNLAQPLWSPRRPVRERQIEIDIPLIAGEHPIVPGHAVRCGSWRARHRARLRCGGPSGCDDSVLAGNTTAVHIPAMSRWLIALVAAGCGSAPSPGTGDDAGPPDDDAAAPPDAATCGLRGGARGLSDREVTIDGLARTYHVYLPATAEPDRALPLVIVHHGYTMSGALMEQITEYTALADSEGIALAFPDGQGGPNSLGAPWNVGTGICPSTAGPPPNAPGDDFALLDHIEADIAEDQCIDREHIFVTGFSMGGYFSHQAGCMRDDIRAVAPHSGGTHDLASCSEARKPIIIFHGTADAVIPAGCADPHALAVVNVTPSADAWAQHNGCTTTTTPRAVQNGTCYHYEGCPAGGQVELCTFAGMGHCWAGGAASAGIYSCPNNEKATQLEWQFFKQYAW
jgi:polyhydroxybutyrate depolymerase